MGGREQEEGVRSWRRAGRGGGRRRGYLHCTRGSRSSVLIRLEPYLPLAHRICFYHARDGDGVGAALWHPLL